MLRVFAAKEGRPFDAGPLYALVDEGGTLILVTPLPGARRVAMAIGVLPLFVPVAAVSVGALVAAAIRIDVALGSIVTLVGASLALFAISSQVNYWTARHLAENPMAKDRFVVKSARPGTFGWHEIRGAANGREISLVVREDWRFVQTTLAETGFTAKKRPKTS